jgi:hypothetical protein
MTSGSLVWCTVMLRALSSSGIRATAAKYLRIASRPSRRIGAGRAKGYSTSASGAYNSSSACHLRCEIPLIRRSKTSRGLADSDVIRHSLRCQQLRTGPVFILTTAQIQPSSQPIPLRSRAQSRQKIHAGELIRPTVIAEI